MFHNFIRRIPKSVAILLLLVVCVLVAGVFWNRSEGGASTRPIHISLAIPAGNEMRNAVIQKIIQQFMESHPDVQVTVHDITGSRYYQKVLVMLASRVGPDIMWMGQSFSEFADRDVFLDLTPYIEKDNALFLEEYNQQSLDWYRYDKKQFAIPFGIDMRIMVYNKNLFDQAGVEYPRDDWTFDEFLAACKKLTVDRDGDGKIDQYGYQGPLELCLFGAKVVSPDGAQAACNQPATFDYLQTTLDMFQNYRVSPTPKEQMQQTGLDSFSIFRQGKYAIMMLATWDLPKMKKQFADMRWDIVLNPKIRQRGQWVSSQAFTVWRDTKHPDVCWELYRALNCPEAQEKLAFQTIPTHRPTLEKAVAKYRGQPKNIAALQTAMDRLYPTPRIPHLQELTALYVNACQSVWTGRATPREAMKNAERQINRTIRRVQR